MTSGSRWKKRARAHETQTPTSRESSPSSAGRIDHVVEITSTVEATAVEATVEVVEAVEAAASANEYPASNKARRPPIVPRAAEGRRTRTRDYRKRTQPVGSSPYS
jgi:cytoskeletal protein RodZ